VADPIRQLAPPIEPVAPALEAAASVAVDPVQIALLALLGALIVVLGMIWWRRRAWSRGLRRILPLTPPAAAADALALHALRHAVVAPAAWWQALDRMRFGRPDESHAEAVATLVAEARDFAVRRHQVR